MNKEVLIGAINSASSKEAVLNLVVKAIEPSIHHLSWDILIGIPNTSSQEDEYYEEDGFEIIEEALYLTETSLKFITLSEISDLPIAEAWEYYAVVDILTSDQVIEKFGLDQVLSSMEKEIRKIRGNCVFASDLKTAEGLGQLLEIIAQAKERGSLISKGGGEKMVDKTPRNFPRDKGKTDEIITLIERANSLQENEEILSLSLVNEIGVEMRLILFLLIGDPQISARARMLEEKEEVKELLSICQELINMYEFDVDEINALGKRAEEIVLNLFNDEMVQIIRVVRLEENSYWESNRIEWLNIVPPDTEISPLKGEGFGYEIDKLGEHPLPQAVAIMKKENVLLLEERMRRLAELYPVLKE